MNKTFIAVLISALVAGCGGGSGNDPIPVKVTVDDPNAPAKTSADLTSGKHLDMSPPTVTSQIPTSSTTGSVVMPAPKTETVPASSLGYSAGPDTVTVVTPPPDTPDQSQSKSQNQTPTQVASSTDGPPPPKSYPPETPNIDTTTPNSKLHCEPAAHNGQTFPDCPQIYNPLPPK